MSFKYKKKLINSGKFENYCNVFENWLKFGIIERASNEKVNDVHYYRTVQQ